MTNEPQNTTEEPKEVPMIEKEAYLRLAADFENYRKRMESESHEIAKFGSAGVVREMVDVMDYLHAALQHAPPNVRAADEWYRGLEQVDKKFLETMKKFGVSRIETVDTPFDPVTMEAVQMVAGGESHRVKEEVRAGYRMHERIIRPARVIIYQ